MIDLGIILGFAVPKQDFKSLTLALDWFWLD
jgi:hypothetical protein